MNQRVDTRTPAPYAMILKGFSKRSKNVAIAGGGILATIVLLILSLGSLTHSRAPEWAPKPRVFAVIPFVENDKDYNYIPYEFVKYIRSNYPYYKVVDEAHIEKIIRELRLIKDGWISPENSAKIGELVGAHILIMFDKSPYRGKELIYPNAYEVQTRLIVGTSRFDPDETNIVDTDVGKSLVVDSREKKSQLSRVSPYPIST